MTITIDGRIFDLLDPVVRLIAADALDEEGRAEEAYICRVKSPVIHPRLRNDRIVGRACVDVDDNSYGKIRTVTVTLRGLYGPEVEFSQVVIGYEIDESRPSEPFLVYRSIAQHRL